jgi:hypothetical protein
MAQKLKNKIFPSADVTIKRLLEQATAGQLTGSWLISGAKGVGKRLLAKSLVELLHPGITESSDVDLIWLAPGAGVEEIREATKFLGFTPTRPFPKIVVIEEVQELNTHSANALLKTLEEPPSYGLLLLTTSEEHKVLPTISSRCFRAKLLSLADEAVEQWLSDNLALSHDEADRIAKMAQGKLGLAEKLATDKVFSEHYAKRVGELVKMLDEPLGQQLAWVSKLPGREELADDLLMLLEWLSDQAGNDPRNALRIQVFDRAIRLIRANINPKLVVAHALVVLNQQL